MKIYMKKLWELVFIDIYYHKYIYYTKYILPDTLTSLKLKIKQCQKQLKRKNHSI